MRMISHRIFDLTQPDRHQSPQNTVSETWISLIQIGVAQRRHAANGDALYVEMQCWLLNHAKDCCFIRYLPKENVIIISLMLQLQIVF